MPIQKKSARPAFELEKEAVREEIQSGLHIGVEKLGKSDDKPASHLPKDIDGLAQFIKQFNKTANEHCWKTILACATATKEGLESEQAKWMQKYVIVAEASYKTMSQHECAAWLDRTRTYPDYFTEEAIKRFNEVKELVESRLHRSRVEAIISMYDALTENEKAEFKRLMDRK